MRALFALTLGCGLLAVAPPPAAADTPPDFEASRAPIEAFCGTLGETMAQGQVLGFEGRRAKLAPAIDATYDIAFMASRALGRKWRTLSPEDQARWISAFRDITLNTYATRFASSSGEKFSVDAVEPSRRGTAIVFTRILSPDSEPVDIRYRMRRDAEGHWRIIDVFLNGTVSELALRHSEYASVIEREGFPHLLESIRAKIAAGDDALD